MAKNEAKIKFTAETSGFNEEIKKANSEMSELRAELKLNETQMKSTGTTVEGLEQKHKILSNQLKSSQDKVEALNQKVNKAVEIYGENSDEVSKLKTQILNAKTAEEKIKQAINACNAELSKQKSSANKVERATERLTDTISEQQKELDDLKEEYVEAVLQYGKNSKEAKELAKEIKNLSRKLSDSKSEMAQATAKADKLDKSIESAGDSAEGAEGGFTILGGTIANLASSVIQGAIGKISEFAGYLAELPNATMELRQDMSTLTTAFDNVGMSADIAKGTWKELYAVFGEDDRAVETANNIARMADSQKELNDWVTITTGVFGTYQDSLPVENLAEASAETVKTGKVTGGLADALNWSSEAAKMFADYMSEDVVTAEDAFNVALSECTTEQERQQLITNTLLTLYGDAAETYRGTAEAQMEAKRAAAEQMQAEANLGAAVEPVTTKFAELKTELIEGATPAVEKISETMVSAMEWMQKHPKTVKAVGAAVATLAVGLGVLATATGIYTVAQWAMNAAVLANPITWVTTGIVAAVALLVGAGVALYQNWDTIKSKCNEVWTNVKEKFGDTKNKVSENVTAMKDKATSKFSEMKTKISEHLKGIENNAKTKFDSIKQVMTGKIDSAKTKIEDGVKKIKGLFNFKWSLPDIKVPHFSVTGGKAPWGFMGKGSLPKVDVTWYAKGGILNSPTIFGINGTNLMGGGEAGPEAILPISVLQEYIDRAFEKNIYTHVAESNRENVYKIYVDNARVNDDEQMRKITKDFLTKIVRLGGMNR